MNPYRVLLFLILHLGVSSFLIAQEEHGLAIGQTHYLYSTKLHVPITDVSQLSFYQHDFPCLVRASVAEPTAPRTNYIIKDPQGELLIGEDQGQLFWKGFKGKDPFFKKQETTVQFVGGVPIYNFADPTDFENEGKTIYYLYFQTEELPRDLETWALIMAYQKIKLKVEVVYSTQYVDSIESEFQTETNYILKSEVSMNVLEMKAHDDTAWTEVDLASNPLFEKYLQPIVYRTTSIHSDDFPLGSVKIYDEPELKIEYRFKKKQRPLPDCSLSEEQIYLYPNPNFGRINIRMIDVPLGEYQFDLYNIVGHKIWTKQLDNKADAGLIHFQLPFVDKGVYLYSIKNKEGKYLQSRRLILVEP